MKWNRLFVLCLTGALALVCTACGSAASSGSAASGSAAAGKDYSQIIHDARTDEYNEAYFILTPDKTGKGTYTATDGFAADLDAEGLSTQGEMLFQMLNLKAEDVEDYAISLSLMNTRSYAVAIVKPAAGKADEVKKAMQDYIDGQKQNMETYLPDQYEVAKAAKLVETESGEVVLVCCEDAENVLSSIEAALKA